MTTAERAAQIWPLLCFAAKNRQVLNYGLLGSLIGVPAAGLGHLLEPIQSYCLLNKLPPLTVLVVQTDTGLPGEGFIASQDVPGAQADVFKRDWLRLRPPTSQGFAEAVSRLPTNGRSLHELQDVLRAT